MDRCRIYKSDDYLEFFDLVFCLNKEKIEDSRLENNVVQRIVEKSRSLIQAGTSSNTSMPNQRILYPPEYMHTVSSLSSHISLFPTPHPSANPLTHTLSLISSESTLIPNLNPFKSTLP